MGQAARGDRHGWLRFAAALGLGTLAAAAPQAQAIRRVFINNGMVSTDTATDSDEVKTNGFSVKKEEQKVIEQFDDFDRFREKKAWDRAFTSLNKLFETGDTGALSPTKDGFWIPTRQKLLRTLLALPPEGREAYHLFYDAQARQQFEQAVAHETAGDADSVAALKKVVDRYFISSMGDQAADHLGDALFETGDYAGAAWAWEQILVSYPESNLPPLRLKMKLATALARSGRMEQFRKLAASIREKHPGEVVKIAGKNVPIDEQLTLLAQPTTQPASQPASKPTTDVSSELASNDSPIQLPATPEPLWQMQFLDSGLQDKIFQQVNQNGWGQQMGSMARAVPTAVTDGKRVYLNWYGILWAVDLQTGKMIWWSDHFKKLAEKFNEMIQWQVDANRFTLTMAGDSMLAVTLNLDKLNNQEPFRLMSIDPATGKKKWSTDSGAMQNWAFIGSPLVVDSTIYITAHPKDNQEIHVIAITLDGKMLWESKLGQPQIGNNWRGLPIYPLPVLKYAAGTLYVMSNNGAVIAFDTISKSIDWAFSYDLPAGQDNSQQRFFGGYQVDAVEPLGRAWLRDGILYFKDRAARMMYAVDLSGPTVLWKRPVDADTAIVGMDDRNFYLLSLGQENTFLLAVDAESGAPLKASKLPDGNDSIGALRAGADYLIFLSRGIYSINTADADVTKDTKIFRGFDTDALGGQLLRAGDTLISVSNLSVTAYSGNQKTDKGPSDEGTKGPRDEGLK